MATYPGLQPLVRLSAALAVALAALVALAEHLLIAPAIVLGAPFIVIGTLMSGSVDHSRSGRVVAWLGLFLIVAVLVSYNWLIPTSFDVTTATAIVP